MTLRNDAITIWKAGVAAVDSEVLVRNSIHADGGRLRVGLESVDPASVRHIEVVGAGKAGAGMARAAEAAIAELAPNASLSGWVNVPEDCVERLEHITLHAARPAGVNEPTPAGVEGTEEILQRVGALSEHDLCLVLVSGGGSALLPAPVPGVSLGDKLAVTRLLASAGAPIHDLNCVRGRLSRVKGGGLRRACRAGRMIVLIISDVIGDPLDVIASGPTVESQSTHRGALDVLRRYDPELSRVPPSVVARLQTDEVTAPEQNRTMAVSHQIIGNNRTALLASAKTAERLGYRVLDLGSENCGDAGEFGVSLFNTLARHRDDSQSSRPICLLAGGETTVQLTPTELPRRGGRNQELVLAAIAAYPSPEAWSNIVLLSGGTDGEDGPTPAAGAFADEDLVRRMNEARRTNEQALNPSDFLSINNSYPFFEQLGGLLVTGPTHTNVMDAQVGLVGRPD